MKPKTKSIAPIAKRQRARRVVDKILESLPVTFQDRPIEDGLEKFKPLPSTDPLARTHRRRVCRHQSRRNFASSGFVYNGAQPSGYYA